MKVIILAGGLGTRLSEETAIIPKPMVEIGRRPILWHIMRHYSHYNFKNFIIALGYKGEVIKKYMIDYCSLKSNLTVNLKNGAVNFHRSNGNETEVDWEVELIDTGLHVQTGGRLKRLAQYLNNETFMMTYGDGVANIDLQELLDFHRSHKKLATMTAVRPPARFGKITLTGNQVVVFSEKPQTNQGWINGGFFVLEPSVTEYIDGDDTIWERGPLERLAADGQLMAKRHRSFWQCLDTLRDKKLLESLWQEGNAPWKTW